MVRIESLAMTIQDLRRMAEKEPSTVVDNAVRYLSIFLEKLCTHELPNESGKGFEMHREVIYPLLEYETFNDVIWAKIRADVEVSIDSLLSNYEEAYGFEPVTIEESMPFWNEDIMKVSFIHRYDEQLQFMGYKIYKKKVK